MESHNPFMFQTTKQIIQMSCASHSPWAPSAFPWL